MTAHSVLFNAIVDREAAPRTISPLFSSRPSLRAATYWGESERGQGGYVQYRTPSLPPLTRPPSTHSGSLSPPIDFNGLITMYEPASPSPVLDLPYDSEWHYSSAYPRNKPSAAIWQSPTTNDYPQWNTLVDGLPDDSPASPYSTETSASTSPSPYISATSSSSSSPTYFLSPSSTPAPILRPAVSRTTSTPADPNARPKKECFHCHVTSTPLWRREPSTQRPLCNACGLYLQQRNRLRPQELIDADIDDPDEPQIPDEEYTGPKCSHCATRQTSVWRRNKEGLQVCNACGVYARLRGKERPLSLKRNKIKPRTKHPR